MEELRRRMASAKAWGIEPASLVTPARDQASSCRSSTSRSCSAASTARPSASSTRCAPERSCARRAQAQGRADGVRRTPRCSASTSRAAACGALRTTRGDIELETLVIACGVWSPRIARMAGAHDPAHPGRAPDDRRRPRAALRGLDQGDRVPDRARHGHRSCTSARTASAWRSAPTRTGRSCTTPTRSPRSRRPRSRRPSSRSRRTTSTPQMEHALELMPEIVGDETVGMKYAINGLLVADAGRHADPRRDARGQGPLVGARGVGQGGPRRRQVASPSGWCTASPRSTCTRPTSRASTTHQKTRAHVRARTSGGVQQDLRDRPPGRAVGVRPRRAAARPFHARERGARRRVLRGRRLGAPALVRVATPGSSRSTASQPREAEWDARWWSPIINAEHLAMRDRAGIFDLTAFAIFDVAGPGRARRRAARGDAPDATSRVGRVVYTPLLTPGGGFSSDLTIMRLGDDHFRVVTGGAHGMADLKWFADHLPADGSAQLVDLTSAWTTLGLWGPRARDILASVTGDDVSHEGFPFAHLPHDRDRPAAGARLAHLLRRRPRLGALRADRAGRAAVGHRLGGRRSRTGSCPPASASTAPPAGSRSATARSAPSSSRVRRRRGRHGLGQGQGPGLRRQGGAPAPPRERAGRDRSAR